MRLRPNARLVIAMLPLALIAGCAVGFGQWMGWW
jgi:hypothetical protein